MKKIILALFLSVTSSFASAALVPNIDFDFGNLNLESEIKSNGTLSFSNEIGFDGETSVYAQVVALTNYQDGGKVTSGSVSGDVRINQKSNTTTSYAFTLYQDANFNEIYSPSSNFSFDLFFYDVDGHDTQGNEYYDVVTVYTPSIAEYTTTTALTISQSDNGAATASGIGTNAIDGQFGLDDFTQDQADVAISFNFTNTATILFDYTIVNTFNNGNRNLVFDANDLDFSGFTTQTLAVTTVPEPASYSLLLLGMLCVSMRRFKTRLTH